MAEWVWVLPSEAVVGGQIAGRKIVVVATSRRCARMCLQALGGIAAGAFSGCVWCYLGGLIQRFGLFVDGVKSVEGGGSCRLGLFDRW